MAFEIKPADASTLPFIAETLVKRSSNPVRQAAVTAVSHDDHLAFFVRQYGDTIDHANRTGHEAVVRVVDRATDRDVAWAHWLLPQDTDDPAPYLGSSSSSSASTFPPGGNPELLTEMRTKYRETRKQALKGRPCFVLHNLYTHADFEGRGAGSLLIRWPFRDADRDGLPVILAARKDSHAVSVYGKHGFKIVAGYDIELNGGKVSFVQMLREPNTAGRLTAALIIVSDTARADPSTDKAAATLKDVFETEGGGKWEVSTTAIVPDDVKLLQERIVSWTGGQAGPDASPFNLIVTTGGTGFALKDQTPEAIEPLLERKAPGLVHLMLSSSLQVTPFAAMARPVAGTRGKTVIVTLPGSPKGAKENLQAVLKLLPHACQQSAGANSRSLHAGGVKKLETDAGVSARKAVPDRQPGVGHSHHDHHHHHHGPGGHQGPAGPHTRPEDRPVPNDPSLGPNARHRQSPYPKLPVAEALSRIFAVTPAPTVTEKAVNPDLVGSILAEDVTAPRPVPAFRASIVDGYACVVSSKGTNDKGTFPVVSISHAAPGTIPPLEAGKLTRITTGAPLPPNASAVIMVEDTVLQKMTADGKEEAEVEILTDRVKDGENVREVGSDIAAGSVVLRKGTKVSAVGGELGVLASVGRARVKVYAKPTVGVMSTGDEIVPHDRAGELRLGEVRDTNRITLTCAIRGWGYDVVDLGIARDDVAGSLEAALRDAVRRAQVVVTTGGVSMGELDLLKPTVERSLGGTIHFGRVAMKPGMPTTFATVPHKAVDGTDATALVFSLPGNPASGMVTASLFMRPCLDLMSGVDKKAIGTPRIKVVLAASTKSDSVREEYQRAVVWQEDDGRIYGQTTGMQRSSRIGSFSSANCLLVIAPGQGTVEKGTVVEGMLLSGLGTAG